MEEALFKDLTEKASVELIDLEEPEEPELELEKEKEKEKEKPKKGTKGKKKKGMEGVALATQTSQANVSTCSIAKATTEASAVATSIGVSSPSLAPSLLEPAFSQSKGNLPNLALRKRKTIALDGSVTSLESYSVSTLIENVDRAELIEIYMATNVHHPTYAHIQEFLAKVCPYTLLSLVY